MLQAPKAAYCYKRFYFGSVVTAANPVYIGKVRWTPTEKVKRNFNHPDTIIANGGHKPIISEELFIKASERIATDKKIVKPRGRPLNECKYWFSGLIKCSNCGSSLTSSGMGNKSPSFQCKGYSSSVCNVSHSISVRKIERAVFDELNRTLSYCDIHEFTAKITCDDTLKEEIRLLKKQLNSVSARLDRTREAYFAGIDSLDEYKENKAVITQRQKELSDELERLTRGNLTAKETGHIVTIKNILDILKSDCHITVKQNAIRSIVDKIIFDRPNSVLEIYYKDV